MNLLLLWLMANLVLGLVACLLMVRLWLTGARLRRKGAGGRLTLLPRTTTKTTEPTQGGA